MSHTESRYDFCQGSVTCHGKKLNQQGLENPVHPNQSKQQDLSQGHLASSLSCQTGVLPIYVGFDRVLSQ